MSFSIQIKAATAPALSELIGGLTVSGGEQGVAGWPGAPVFLYRPLVSCRSVELRFDSGELTVTLRAMPSESDRDIAVELVRSCARLSGATEVTAEGQGPSRLEDLDDMLGAEWLQGQQESGARMITHLVRTRGPMTVPGAVRPWCVGPRVLDELEGLSDDRPMHARMIERMHRVQWIDRTEGYFPATQLIDDTKRTLAVWQPTRRSLMPESQFVILNKEPDDVIVLTHERFVGLAGNRLGWLDESQTLVEAIPPAEVEALLARAEAHDQKVQLIAGPEPCGDRPARPWWRFW